MQIVIGVWKVEHVIWEDVRAFVGLHSRFPAVTFSTIILEPHSDPLLKVRPVVAAATAHCALGTDVRV